MLRAAGCEVVPFELSRSGLAPWTEWRAWRRLLALYLYRQPDLAHHVALKPVLERVVAVHRAGVPAVVNALAGLGYLVSSSSLKARLLRPVVAAALRRALRGERSRLIVQNPEDRGVLLSAGLVEPEQIVLMRGAGVALDQFFPAPEPPGPPVVLLPARMLWAKGVGGLRGGRAHPPTERNHRPLRAGRSNRSGQPDRRARRTAPGALANENPQAPVVGAPGGHRGGAAAERLVCLPSTYGEGVPKALLEAAATGRAIITTDTPGCREVVRDRENGLLVPPGDLAALVDALDLLLSDPQLRTRLGRVGRARAESEFAEADVIRPTLELYRELLDSAG